MPSLNKDEFGQVLRVNMLTDVSTNTALNFVLEPKYGEKLEKSTGVTVGTVNITVDDEQYLANEYIQYTTVDGDLDKSGQWRCKGIVTISSTEKIVSDYKTFTVLD